MIGALALVFGEVEARFVALGGVRSSQICRIGDMVGDTIRTPGFRDRGVPQLT
jgi:hypothetical protein